MAATELATVVGGAIVKSRKSRVEFGRGTLVSVVGALTRYGRELDDGPLERFFLSRGDRLGRAWETRRRSRARQGEAVAGWSGRWIEYPGPGVLGTGRRKLKFPGLQSSSWEKWCAKLDRCRDKSRAQLSSQNEDGFVAGARISASTTLHIKWQFSQMLLGLGSPAGSMPLPLAFPVRCIQDAGGQWGRRGEVFLQVEGGQLSSRTTWKHASIAQSDPHHAGVPPRTEPNGCNSRPTK